ncbi:hypothetical protein HYH02_003513 [Chlamydomonas schloesseri]|uniref:KANL3/Tex30 alpha/beta hydrolase-like domain-containing protein n=1 Tax=Chlamydomonas schloesseri TaxID=2026947 RepID=A0A836B9N9_9CHLO|nr:hypothetical protein HYH02_003513 [Chlamydomonas schloesseri]|eukprot:KAG2451733.1 hypothetical protein HYH02_003513 [Chlamydomonas schloesseri]
MTTVVKQVAQSQAGKPPIPVKLDLPGGAVASEGLPGAPPHHAALAAGVVLAHGAGGDMDSGHLPQLAAQLAAAGVAVVRFTCKPPHLPTRVAAFEAVLRAAAAEWPETRCVRRWFAAGHSMGGRAACEVAHTSWQQQQQLGHPQHPGQQSCGAEAPAGGRDQAAAGTGTGADTDTDTGMGMGVGSGERSRKRQRSTLDARGQHGPAAGSSLAAAANAAAVSVTAGVGTAERARRRGPARAGRAALGPAPVQAKDGSDAAVGGGQGVVLGADVTGSIPAPGSEGQVGAGKRGKRAAAAAAAKCEAKGADGGVSAAVTSAPLPAVCGCVLMSYPLHPPDKPAELRDVPLVGLRLPVLFVRGSRDPFSLPAAQWELTLTRMRQAGCPSLQVHTVEGGDHGLAVPKNLLAATATAAAAGPATAAGTGRKGRGKGSKAAGARGSVEPGAEEWGERGGTGDDAAEGGERGESNRAPLDVALRAVVDWVLAESVASSVGTAARGTSE